MNTHSWNRRGFLKATLLAAAAPAIVRGAVQAGFEIGLVADAQFADIDDIGTDRAGANREVGLLAGGGVNQLEFLVGHGSSMIGWKAWQKRYAVVGR